MTTYHCDSRWHNEIETDADYFIRGLRRIEDSPDYRSRYQVADGPDNNGFACCNLHLELATEIMLERYDRVITRRLVTGTPP